MPSAISRRTALRASALCALGLALPRRGWSRVDAPTRDPEVPAHFPHIDPEVVAQVVGRSHFDLEGVKALVEPRPELARSVWEWRFSDFESAIGAASHVGRRDIALYLMDKGARPTLFTFAMLGAHDVVQAAVAAAPGIQRTAGPHGISLLDHAHAGGRMQGDMTAIQVEDLRRTVALLEALGDAGGPNYLEVSAEEQGKYLGDYHYGPGPEDGFTIDLNMRKLLALGPIGGAGGALYRIGPDTFIYNGAPSVTVTFHVREGLVQALTLREPSVEVTARKVS